MEVDPRTPTPVGAQHAEYVCAGEPERHTLIKHLRRHGWATPMHVWASQCRWCHLSSWVWAVKQPVAYDVFDILQQRVTKLEQERHSDGADDGT